LTGDGGEVSLNFWERGIDWLNKPYGELFRCCGGPF